MTDKEKIINEIERLKAEIPYHENAWSVLNKLKGFINSLPDEQLCWNDMTEEEKSGFFFDLSHQKQIKQPSEDLEKAAKEYVKENCILPEDCNDGNNPYYEECTAAVFKDGAQWQKEQTIKKACEWLNKNVVEYHPRKGELRPIVNINAFREAMKKEDE